VWQIGCEVGDLVGIELLGCYTQLVATHGGDQGFAHRIGNFNQDFAVTISLDQIPYQQALGDRQGFQNVGYIGRMEAA